MAKSQGKNVLPGRFGPRFEQSDVNWNVAPIVKVHWCECDPPRTVMVWGSLMCDKCGKGFKPDDQNTGSTQSIDQGAGPVGRGRGDIVAATRPTEQGTADQTPIRGRSAGRFYSPKRGRRVSILVRRHGGRYGGHSPFDVGWSEGRSVWERTEGSVDTTSTTAPVPEPPSVGTGSGEREGGRQPDHRPMPDW